MWTFGHSVREIERSHHEVVVEETSTKGAVILFGASFAADRTRRALIIKRRIGILTREKVYDAGTIDRIFVRVTINGDGLAVRFKSGRSKSLTMSLGSGVSLEDAAAALNQFLYVPHRG